MIGRPISPITLLYITRGNLYQLLVLHSQVDLRKPYPPSFPVLFHKVTSATTFWNSRPAGMRLPLFAIDVLSPNVSQFHNTGASSVLNTYVLPPNHSLVKQHLNASSN